MTIGLPIVSSRKRRRSSEICQGISPRTPITLFVDTATMRLIDTAKLYGDSRRDVRVRLVVQKFKVIETIVENRVGSALDGESWRRQRFTL